MTKYNYMNALKADIREYIDFEVTLSDYTNRENFEKSLYEQLLVEDSVTGNTSGTYTFDKYKAEELICHNLDLLAEAIQEFCEENVLEKGAEWCDVTIRCYLLRQALHEIMYEMNDELEKAFT